MTQLMISLHRTEKHMIHQIQNKNSSRVGLFHRLANVIISKMTTTVNQIRT
jgi:hypothetical protein